MKITNKNIITQKSCGNNNSLQAFYAKKLNYIFYTKPNSNIFLSSNNRRCKCMPKKVKVKQKVKKKKKGAGTEKIEKNIRSIELKPEIEETLRKEVPKMDVITPNQIASKYNIRLSLAKKALKYLSESGLIKPVATSRRIKIYTNVAAE